MPCYLKNASVAFGQNRLECSCLSSAAYPFSGAMEGAQFKQATILPANIRLNKKNLLMTNTPTDFG